MKKFIITAAMAIASFAAYAACTTHTIMTQDGKTIFCTTCCYNGNCTTTCV